MTETKQDESRCERRSLFNLTQEQHEWIRGQAHRMKITMSELIRQILRREMDSGGKAKKE
jgi:hypothetical protein